MSIRRLQAYYKHPGKAQTSEERKEGSTTSDKNICKVQAVSSLFHIDASHLWRQVTLLWLRPVRDAIAERCEARIWTRSVGHVSMKWYLCSVFCTQVTNNRMRLARSAPGQKASGSRRLEASTRSKITYPKGNVGVEFKYRLHHAITRVCNAKKKMSEKCPLPLVQHGSI